MLYFSFLLHRLFVPVAQAVTLDQNGAGAPGVDSMWTTIKGLFMGRGTWTPEQAVTFFTNRIIDFLFVLIGMIAVGLLMYAGIRVMIGGEEGLTEAKKIFTSTLIGVALALLAWVVIAFIMSIHQLLLS